MKRSLLLVILIGVVLQSCSTPKELQRVPIDQEYSVELINQDSCAVYSHSTGVTYRCKFSDVNEIFLIDNI